MAVSLFPGTSQSAILEREYSAIENDIRRNESRFGDDDELKACHLRMKERKRLFTLLQKSQCVQFGVVVDQKRLRDNVFASKGSKQRYMDWALKMGVKKGVLEVINRGIASKRDIDHVFVFVDEHSSTTEGKYNLSQSIDEEFRLGMYDSYGTFHDPVFSPSFPKIPVHYLDSRSVTLIRAADITANWIYCAERDRLSYPFAMRSVESTTVLYRHP
jgi:hypothetical protein